MVKTEKEVEASGTAVSATQTTPLKDTKGVLDGFRVILGGFRAILGAFRVVLG